MLLPVLPHKIRHYGIISRLTVDIRHASRAGNSASDALSVYIRLVEGGSEGLLGRLGKYNWWLRCGDHRPWLTIRRIFLKSH